VVGWEREEGSGYGHVIATDMLGFLGQWETNTALVVSRERTCTWSEIYSSKEK